MNSPSQFKFPAHLTVEQFISQLSSEINCQFVTPQQCLKTYYDSFDWRLYAYGMLAECVKVKTKSSFTLKTIKNGLVIASTELHKVPHFSHQFKCGGVRNTLEPILEMRALLPVGSVAYKSHTFNIIDDSKKTMVRLVVEEYEQFAPCVLVQTLKGYDKTAASVIELLTAKLGLIATTKSSLFMVLKQQGRKVGDYSSKLAIQLHADMRADSACKTIYSYLLKTIRDNEQGTIADTDSEFLHDFRVAVRRTRSALSQLKNVLPDDINTHYTAFFSWLGEITGATRDLDVYLLNFSHYKDSLPVEIREHLNPLHDYLINKQRQAQQELAEKLRSTEYLTALLAWEQMLKEPVATFPEASNAELTIKQLADKRLRKNVKRVLREGQAITDLSPAEDLHELRKSCKKLRYLMEFFQSIYTKNKIKNLIKSLKGLQEVLGDFQDCEIQENNLRLFSAEMHTLDIPAETFAAIECLIDNLETHRREIRSHFALKFAEFTQEETLLTFKVLFG